ncbi:hypothetical protein [Streptosporangium subroseum]|uniref:hypothetical protein n=1 Tax=Streptosporangium subroseum TaxID=106412 RepID=UPI00117D74DF|nr:hypothetical protein [Streptosporangium subroseum]
MSETSPPGVGQVILKAVSPGAALTAVSFTGTFPLLIWGGLSVVLVVIMICAVMVLKHSEESTPFERFILLVMVLLNRSPTRFLEWRNTTRRKKRRTPSTSPSRALTTVEATEQEAA